MVDSATHGAEMQKKVEKTEKMLEMRRILVSGVGEGQKSRAFGF
jgi:hypothetical protein